MVCTGVKPGFDCTFMTKKGCEFNGGTCHVVIDKCGGCLKVKEFPTGNYCVSFPDPTAKWRFGNCNMATHIKVAQKKETPKLNPLKASKRSAR